VADRRRGQASGSTTARTACPGSTSASVTDATDATAMAGAPAAAPTAAEPHSFPYRTQQAAPPDPLVPDVDFILASTIPDGQVRARRALDRSRSQRRRGRCIVINAPERLPQRIMATSLLSSQLVRGRERQCPPLPPVAQGRRRGAGGQAGPGVLAGSGGWHM
jgi:hypothetical protein